MLLLANIRNIKIQQKIQDEFNIDISLLKPIPKTW
ncbi:MAG: hypothetical protein K0Q51_856 [Rickettsiaceae bacterium]|jgi:hypothetical protein|nr:hypothetical protein [Rickettsiaceae bacterium]